MTRANDYGDFTCRRARASTRSGEADRARNGLPVPHQGPPQRLLHRSGLPATPARGAADPHPGQTTEQCTVQRPGCLRAALLVHRGCPTRRPYRCHARRRRAEDDAQKHAGRIDSGRLGSALTLRLETWKLPSWSRCWPVPTIAARTCREHPDDDPPVQVGSCVRAAVLPRAAQQQPGVRETLSL